MHKLQSCDEYCPFQAASSQGKRLLQYIAKKDFFFFSVVKGEKIKSVHNTNIIPYSNYLILQLISISSTYPETKLCIYSEIFIHDIVYSPFSSNLNSQL